MTRPLPRGDERTLQIDPEVRLRYQAFGRRDAAAPVILLANGLGGRIYAWEHLLRRFEASHRILTWDYRGLFGSTRPSRPRGLAIGEHARDAVALLDHEQVERATLVGWSMGVQVSLETALAFPDRVRALGLLNGTYGQVFQTGMQPVCRVPGIPGILHGIVERLTRGSAVGTALAQAAARSELHLRLASVFLRLWKNDRRLGELYRQYVDDVFGDSFVDYLRLFQELDAHSVYHHLPDVPQPTLVISGGMDWLTPAKDSFKIARRIPRAEHLHFPLGSHFAVIEYPEKVLSRLEQFLLVHG